MSEQNEVKECCECCANDKPVNAGPLMPGANLGAAQDPIRAFSVLPPWQERFLEEYKQLKTRYFKLHMMLVKLDNDVLDFKPTCPVSLLAEQEQVMRHYLDVLEKRAVIEHISLPF